MRVADYIWKTLADKGVRHVFLVTGGGAMHLNDALGREVRIKYVCNLHEQACAMAAEGYARISRDALAGHDIIINGDGTPMRSYLYADDLVEWLFALLDRGESGRVYNVGSPEAISIRGLAVLVRDALGAKSEVKVLGEPVPGAANFYVPAVSRIQSELGVEVKHPLAEAIRESV